jgi:catechol 2,3-dioxygenase-like lactoylglutathione lyase family enzyme
MSKSARLLCLFVIAITATALGAKPRRDTKTFGGTHMKLLRSTPIQVVDRIEPNLGFWVDGLGFTKTAEVPGDDKNLAFVILEKDGLEVMLQTRKSIAADPTPTKLSADDLKSNTTIQYLEVDSLDEVLKGLHGAPLLMEPVNRPYGMREILVRDPSGYLIEFAEKLK